MPPVRAMNRWMDLVEHPTAAAALAKASPSETRRWISTWSPWLNRLPWSARRRCISPPSESVTRIIAEMLRRSLETAGPLLDISSSGGRASRRHRDVSGRLDPTARGRPPSWSRTYPARGDLGARRGTVLALGTSDLPVCLRQLRSEYERPEVRRGLSETRVCRELSHWSRQRSIAGGQFRSANTQMTPPWGTWRFSRLRLTTACIFCASTPYPDCTATY